ncbi:MAG: VWA-like domain-containing protein [Lachnospiraceae bacterium]|nr:VWA-like domain-containing protein [Lachnospiraceae bacterium]
MLVRVKYTGAENMKGQELLEEFKRVRRDALKLEIALEIFRPGMEQELSEEERQEIFRYLEWRKRSAVQYLIQRGDLVRLRALKKRGWLEEQYLENYREMAIQAKETEIWAWLVRYGVQPEPESSALPLNCSKPKDDLCRKTEVTGETGAAVLKSAAAEETACSAVQKNAEGNASPAYDAAVGLCKRVWELTLKNLRMKLPGLSEALGTLRFTPDAEVKYLACDGFTVYYAPDSVLQHYRQNAGGMERDLLHMILHNMYLHPVLMRNKSQPHWNLACDLTVERILDSWQLKGLERPGADFRSYHLKELKLPRRWNSVDTMYETLMEQYPSLEKLKQLEELNRIDDHCRWLVYRPKEDEDFRRESSDDGEGQPGTGDGKAFIDQWDRLRKEWNPQMGEEHNRAGNQSGVAVQKTPVKQKKEYDYRHFLEGFMVCQEEVELDLDSIDYLPYWYSRNHYKDIVLIEPLEYKEVHKLDEMVIAIDTSGSCSGRIVKRFLQETWSILTESGNFFKKMHVHIIQCDSAIQEHVVVHSREEFQEYMEDVTVKGLGGTDFRPVFELVQKLIQEKELLNLKALLYFTDGDGVFPKEKPPFETAFIFLNRAYEKQKIPEWAIRLNLGLKLEE